MDRLFLDANILFSAAYRDTTGLLDLWKLKQTVLCSSSYALEEARFNLEGQSQKERLERLAGKLELFDAAIRELPHDVLLPEKDAPILLAAVEARATHLITGDIRHFGPYFGKRILGILITTPSEYLSKRRRR